MRKTRFFLIWFNWIEWPITLPNSYFAFYSHLYVNRFPPKQVRKREKRSQISILIQSFERIWFNLHIRLLVACFNILILYILELSNNSSSSTCSRMIQSNSIDSSGLLIVIFLGHNASVRSWLTICHFLCENELNEVMWWKLGKKLNSCQTKNGKKASENLRELRP